MTALPMICKKAKCTDPKAEDSVYCARHRDRKPPSAPPPPAANGNGHPGKHVELTAAYLRERIAFLQGEIQQLEQAAAVLDVLALPPA